MSPEPYSPAAPPAAESLMRVHFVNENLGGHATMHLHLRGALAMHRDVQGTFWDAPAPGVLHRLARLPVPGLARLDLDLAPLRDQLARALTVRRHLQQLGDDIDVLHVYTHNAALLSAEALRRVPTVVSLDATNRQNAVNLPYRRPTRFTGRSGRAAVVLERRVYERARAIVTHSRWAADSVQGYGVDPTRIHVIPFGIPVPPRPAPHSDDGLPRILFVGTTMDRKGGWRLLDLWRRHLRDRSRLVLVTREVVPPEPGLEVRNDIRPDAGNLQEVLRTADIYAMPGDIDAFGYALLEAMAAGLPPVGPDLAAVPEIIEHGRSGLLVPPRDDRAFCAALDELVTDAARRRELGAAAHRRVRDRFDSVHTTAALVEVLRSVG